MNILKKLITVKILIVIISISILLVVFISIISTVAGVSIGYEKKYNQLENKNSNEVINNQLYAGRYKKILNKYLISNGYVSLERLVFYLQRTNNILDVTVLDDNIWEEAYLNNLNPESKQMIPIKTVCKNLKQDISLPEFNIESGTNHNGVLIDVIDLCNVDGEDISTSNNYTDIYPYLPFVFPLQTEFDVTSIVFENRSVSLDVSQSEQNRINHHSGWDFSVPTGTNFYSICDGKIKSIVNTQFNDLPYNQSKNGIGNYVEVTCDNGLIAGYYHIQANSVPFIYNQVGTTVKKGSILGRTSATGLSTKPHLHLGLKDEEGKLLDALNYIDFTNKK